MTFTSSDSSHARQEFVQNPDIRTISSFFLGWAFILAVYFLVIHMYHHYLPAHLKSQLQLGSGEDTGEKTEHRTRDALAPDHDASYLRTFKILGLLINLSVTAATLGIFASLLAFHPSNASASCAFSVAWGGLTAQLVRSSSFAQLSCELKNLRVKRVEYWIGWLVNILSLTSSFIVQGLGGGFTVPVGQIPGLVLCYKAHPLAPAIVNAAINILFEIYLLVRFYTLIVPEFLRAKHRREALQDSRLARVLALLLLDAVTILPNIIAIDVAADVIPFSIGSILVLVAFNYRPPILNTGMSIVLPSSASLASIDRRPTGTTTRSIRSSRSAVPGDGGYGFESNVRLRSDLLRPSDVPPVPRHMSLVPPITKDGVVSYESHKDESLPALVSPGSERRRKAPNLSRLIIPVATGTNRSTTMPVGADGNVAPLVSSSDLEMNNSSQPSVSLQPQRSSMAGMRSPNHGSRPIPTGPRPLPKALTLSSVSSSTTPVPYAPMSAPASQTAEHLAPAGLTPLAVTMPSEDSGQIWISSPLASSVAFPSTSVSRNPSESARTASGSIIRSSRSGRSLSVSTSMWSQPLTSPPNVPLPPTPSFPVPASTPNVVLSGPARYRNIQTHAGRSSYLPISSTGTTSGGLEMARPHPELRTRTILPSMVPLTGNPPTQWRSPILKNARSKPVSSMPVQQLSPSANTGNEPRLDISPPRYRPTLSQRITLIGADTPLPFDHHSNDNTERFSAQEVPEIMLPRDQYSSSDQTDYHNRHLSEYAESDRRRTSTLRTSLGPMTGSSVSTFEIVEIPPRVPSISAAYRLQG